MRFAARVEIVRDGVRIDAKSILNILTLGATQGTELIVEANGDDAAAAVEELARLVEGDFPEDDPHSGPSTGATGYTPGNESAT